MYFHSVLVIPSGSCRVIVGHGGGYCGQNVFRCFCHVFRCRSQGKMPQHCLHQGPAHLAMDYVPVKILDCRRRNVATHRMGLMDQIGGRALVKQASSRITRFMRSVRVSRWNSYKYSNHIGQNRQKEGEEAYDFNKLRLTCGTLKTSLVARPFVRALVTFDSVTRDPL